MKKFKFYFAFIISFLGSAVARSEEPISADTVSTLMANPNSRRTPGFFRLSLLGYRTQNDPDYRTVKLSGGAGDSGGGTGGGSSGGAEEGGGDMGGGGSGGNNSNLSYLSAFGVLPGLASRDYVSFVGLQSLNNEKSRSVVAPNGMMVTPASLLSAKYTHPVTDNISSDLRVAYLSSVHFTDPSLGATWRDLSYEGWSKRVMLSSSLPITERSRSSSLVTRSALRGVAEYSWSQFRYYGAFSFSKAFYGNAATSQQVASSDHPSRGGHSRGNPNLNGSIPSGFKPDELDLLLLDRENHRSSVSTGFVWNASDSIRLSTGGKLTLIKTLTGGSIWSSVYKPVGLVYSLNSWDFGADFSFSSQATDFKNPPLPRLWNIGISFSYSWGDMAYARI